MTYEHVMHVFKHVSFKSTSPWGKFYCYHYHDINVYKSMRGYIDIGTLNALLVDYNAIAVVPEKFAHSYYVIKFKTESDYMFFSMRWA